MYTCVSPFVWWNLEHVYSFILSLSVYIWTWYIHVVFDIRWEFFCVLYITCIIQKWTVYLLFVWFVLIYTKCTLLMPCTSKLNQTQRFRLHFVTITYILLLSCLCANKQSKVFLSFSMQFSSSSTSSSFLFCFLCLFVKKRCTSFVCNLPSNKHDFCHVPWHCSSTT